MRKAMRMKMKMRKMRMEKREMGRVSFIIYLFEPADKNRETQEGQLTPTLSRGELMI
jgi:hypothetical protein